MLNLIIPFFPLLAISDHYATVIWPQDCSVPHIDPNKVLKVFGRSWPITIEPIWSRDNRPLETPYKQPARNQKGPPHTVILLPNKPYYYVRYKTGFWLRLVTRKRKQVRSRLSFNTLKHYQSRFPGNSRLRSVRQKRNQGLFSVTCGYEKALVLNNIGYWRRIKEFFPQFDTHFVYLKLFSIYFQNFIEKL